MLYRVDRFKEIVPQEEETKDDVGNINQVNAERKPVTRWVTRTLFVVPAESRKYVVVLAHDKAGHFGVDKTIALMKRHYWFPKMKEYTARHIQACLDCVFNKRHSGKRLGELNPIEPERRPFQKVFCDHAGPLPKSHGMEHIIVLVDGLTKFVVLEALKSTNADGDVEFLTKTFAQYGDPDFQVIDGGTAFTGKRLRTSWSRER